MGLLAYVNVIIQKIPFIAAGLAGVGAVMAFHELGHFVFGKLFNVHIPNFSIGMGPKLLSKKVGETTFSLSLVPVGAYVEADNDPKTAGGKERTISAKSYWQKMCIVGGGILFNLIFAYVIFLGLSMHGIPSNPIFAHNSSYSIEKVLPNSAADKAGVKPGDKIVEINHEEVSKNISALLKSVAGMPNQNTVLVVERDGQKLSLPICLGSKTVKGKKCGTLGVQFSFPSMPPVPFSQAVVQAAELVNRLVCDTFKGIGQALTKRSAENFAGPLMMISLTIESVGQGMSLFFLFLAFISVGLAALNAIPLAVLDGGHALVYTLEAILRRPLNETFEQYFQYASLALIGGLFIYLTFKDVFLLFLS